jgi:tRNA(Met) C34 N-acetyltransferase TmcA
MENWIPTIVGLAIIVLGAGGLLVIVKKSLKEVVDLLTSISTALEDNKITTEEFAKIGEEIQHLKDSFKKTTTPK